MPNLVNHLIAKELTDEFSSAESFLIVSFGGIPVSASEALRGTLESKGVSFRMVRNSLARRVLAEKGLEFGDDVLRGNTAIAYGATEAAIEAAKILTDKEVKKLGKVKVKAGMLEGRILDSSQAAALASIPDRETLWAQMAGVLIGPLRNLASVLNANPGALARVLQARADKLESGS